MLKENLTTATRSNQSLSTQLSHHTTQESHIADLEASLSDLQTRYETKVRSHGHLQLEKTDLLSALEKAQNKVADQAAEITSLKESNRRLQSDLDRAENQLRGDGDVEVVRLVTAESNARAAEKEVATLTNKITSVTSDLDFARRVYQSTSVTAANLGVKVTSLTAQLETAERKAQGEAARLAEVNKDNAVKEAKKQVRQLKVALEERDKMCRRKEEEIETLKGRRGRGGGVVTRGGSVQPGVGQGKSPRGSRGGSPMAGVGIGGEGMRRGGSGLRGEVVG